MQRTTRRIFSIAPAGLDDRDALSHLALAWAFSKPNSAIDAVKRAIAIIAGSITDPAQLARRERCTERQINLMLSLSLAFLSPQLVNAAVEGQSRAASKSSACVIPTRTGLSNSSDLGLDPN